jgi:hypothetical protein
MLHGLTGMIQFDNEGFRTNIVLEIMGLSYNGLEHVANWSSKGGLDYINRTVVSTSQYSSENLQNRTFRVITALVSLLLREQLKLLLVLACSKQV